MRLWVTWHLKAITIVFFIPSGWLHVGCGMMLLLLLSCEGGDKNCIFFCKGPTSSFHSNYCNLLNWQLRPYTSPRQDFILASCIYPYIHIQFDLVRISISRCDDLVFSAYINTYVQYSYLSCSYDGLQRKLKLWIKEKYETIYTISVTCLY